MTHSPAAPILYGTSACHLCELAEQLLCQVLGEAGFQKVDIAGSDALFERMGLRIPVVAYNNGAELGWPFSLEELLVFLEQESGASTGG